MKKAFKGVASMKQTIEITIDHKKTRNVEVGMPYVELAKQFQEGYDTPIAAVKLDGTLKELQNTVKEEVKEVVFVDLHVKDGIRIYQRTATFMMIVAAHKLFPEQRIIVNHHISGGYFCEFADHAHCTEENMIKLKKEMQRLAEANLPINKSTIKMPQAMELFEKSGMPDKQELMKYRRTSSVNVYELEGIYNYFYGYMIPCTGAVKLFDLIPYAHGFILLFPDEKNPTQLVEFKPQPKLSEVFRESERWARIMNVDVVASLNDVISQGKAGDLIRISEALHEKRIAQIADQITDKKDIKLVLIAGPSSSGKTTFAQRLCIQLRVNGMKPHAISLDDYFVNREFTPKDENGDFDFESLDAIDVALFNQHMTKLIAGEEVEIPSFNFKTGRREYKGHMIKLEADEILVVEGIHGLNEKLSYAVEHGNKFKIYVSCLTQLNVDDHNRIPTTDTRLIRRMLRDNDHRGIRAERTLELWPSVRRGEEKNIFPFQEEADTMFNTVLIYELAVLKQKAEPLLFGIPHDSPYYPEAKRLLKFLAYFLPVESVEIPNNSIVREFVGGSCFH